MAAFGTIGTIGTAGLPMTTMAAPLQTFGAPYTTIPTQTIAAAPAVEYIQSAPVYETVTMQAAPVTMQAAPVMTEMIMQPAAPRNLLAMGNVISERVITIEELASIDRYRAEEAVMVEAPRAMIMSQPMVEYVQPAPAIEYIQAAPAVEYITSQPAVQTFAAPQFIGSAPLTIGSAPYTAAPQTFIQSTPMTYGAPLTTLAQ